MKSRIDILGLGCTAVDEVLYVPAWPPADVKTRVLQRERHCGGLTATALVAASRLGARCVYAGVLGDDENSRYVLDCLSREGVDVSQAIRRKVARPVQSVIVVDERRKTRNIFFQTDGVAGASDKSPSRGVILSARVLFVDNFGIQGMIRAARIARAAGIPVVADFEHADAPRFGELLALVDHLILSEAFACKFTGTVSPAVAVSRLWNERRRVVSVTCGVKGCFYLDQSGELPKHAPAFQVKAQDTTGCGDVFHGAYAMALARGMELSERIRFASAAAALKATGRGGQDGIPTLTLVKRFLKQQSQ
ncbi:MAG: permease [Verrucomicrobia bacterium]|nr:permease [Verrucomicrobiota bacterium]